MNRKRLVLIAAVVAVVAGTAFFLAPRLDAGTATANLAISATVPTNCTITGGTVAFGAYDPLVTNATTELDGTGTFTMSCTKGTAATVSLGLGSNASGSTRNMKITPTGTDLLTYELYTSSARTTVWNATNTMAYTSTSKATVNTMTVYGKVLPGQDVSAGSYADTVVATITF
jgi:spore coat protein U-like protein